MRTINVEQELERISLLWWADQPAALVDLVRRMNAEYALGKNGD